MEKQKKMKNTHEIIYVARTGESKRVVNRICRFETAEEAQQCIKKLKLIDARQKLIAKRKIHKKKWNEKDIMKLQEVFEKEDNGLAFLMILNADIRAGELCALTWCDVDLEKGIVNITKTVDSYSFTNRKLEIKNLRDARVVRLPEDLVSKLSLYKEQQDTASDSDYLFNNNGEVLKTAGLKLLLKKTLEKVDIDENIALHDLRRMSKVKRQVDS